MTVYAPCAGCAVAPATCKTRIVLRGAFKAAKAAGAGMIPTAIRGKCKARVATFRPGQQVMVRTFINEPVMTPLVPGEDRIYDWWPGVVIAEHGSRATVYVAIAALSKGGERFVPNGTGFMRIHIKHLTLIPDAPAIDVEECKVCGQIPGMLEGECGGGSDYNKIRCPHVEARHFLEGGFTLVGSQWVDPAAENPDMLWF